MSTSNNLKVTDRLSQIRDFLNDKTEQHKGSVYDLSEDCMYLLSIVDRQAKEIAVMKEGLKFYSFKFRNKVGLDDDGQVARTALAKAEKISK